MLIWWLLLVRQLASGQETSRTFCANCIYWLFVKLFLNLSIGWLCSVYPFVAINVFVSLCVVQMFTIRVFMLPIYLLTIFAPPVAVARNFISMNSIHLFLCYISIILKEVFVDYERCASILKRIDFMVLRKQNCKPTSCTFSKHQSKQFISCPAWQYIALALPMLFYCFGVFL